MYFYKKKINDELDFIKNYKFSYNEDDETDNSYIVRYNNKIIFLENVINDKKLDDKQLQYYKNLIKQYKLFIKLHTPIE